jgi:CheY-like chemotaxis protein
MDFNMAIMNGVEAAKRIRELQERGQANKDMMIIMVSGDKISETGAHYFDLGLTKPIKYADLKRAINM